MQIIDIFGNEIKVSNLDDAINETRIFVGFSEKATETDSDFSFDEFKLVETSDQFGKTFKVQQRTNSGESETSLNYYKHNLKQLLTLKQAKNDK